MVMVGTMNELASMGIPVTPLKTAQPPSRSMAETIALAAMPYQKKMKCAHVPQRSLMISRKVWALGARRFTSMATMPNRRI